MSLLHMALEAEELTIVEECPITDEHISEVSAILHQSEALEALRDRLLQRQTLEKSVALESYRLLGNETVVDAFYTGDQSQSYRVALEGIVGGIMSAVTGAISKVIELIGRFISWVFGGSGSNGDGVSSSSAASQVTPAEWKAAEKSLQDVNRATPKNTIVGAGPEETSRRDAAFAKAAKPAEQTKKKAEDLTAELKSNKEKFYRSLAAHEVWLGYKTGSEYPAQIIGALKKPNIFKRPLDTIVSDFIKSIKAFNSEMVGKIKETDPADFKKHADEEFLKIADTFKNETGVELTGNFAETTSPFGDINALLNYTGPKTEFNNTEELLVNLEALGSKLPHPGDFPISDHLKTNLEELQDSLHALSKHIDEDIAGDLYENSPNTRSSQMWVKNLIQRENDYILRIVVFLRHVILTHHECSRIYLGAIRITMKVLEWQIRDCNAVLRDKSDLPPERVTEVENIKAGSSEGIKGLKEVFARKRRGVFS
jgi:hypothetical protein